MGKIKLEFDSYEEREEAQNAIDGAKWKAVAIEFDEELRKTTKYGSSIINQESASELEISIAEKYRERLRELISDIGLTFN
jgi:hypothetical protein